MNRILKNIVYVAIGAVLGQALISLRAFFLARLLDPADYGVWAGVQTIVALAPIASLGTVEALLKKVPYFRGKRDMIGLRQIESTVLGTLVISVIVLVLLLLVGARFLPFRFIHQNLLLTQVTAAAAAIGYFTSYYYYRSTAYENFKLVGVFDTLRGATAFLLILPFAWRWGVMGATFAFLLSEILNWLVIGSLACRTLGGVQPRFDLSQMAGAVRVGLPITVIWWIYSVYASIDRITTITFLGNTQAGLLGVGSSIPVFLVMAQNMVCRVFYPRINTQIGAKVMLSELRRSVVVPASTIAALLPFAQTLAFFALPILYDLFLPKYKDGVTCARIFIFSSFFVGLVRNGANYLIAINLEAQLLKYLIVSVVINVAGSIAFATLGFGINGIAVSTFLAGALLSSLIWSRVFRELNYAWKERVRLSAGFYVPFVSTLLAVGIVSLTGFAYPDNFVSWPVLEMVAVLAVTVISIIALPTTCAEIKDLRNRLCALFHEQFRRVAPKKMATTVEL